MASFKTNSEIYLNLLSFPKKIMFQNYISANKTADALNTIKNSLVVATLTTVFNTVVGMMAAYILSRKDYKFLKWVYVFFMIGVMVPVHCTLIPINNIATALCKEQPVLPDPDLCCVWYVPGDIPLYRIHGWNLQEPG